ncbi:DNA gyrase inhibitor YacG [Acuticoccus sp.]|uniref:DNA gyrase inhibitor YacG n=1 Tax=Acuticoccus sp. TaxID=1904378 RepID=UPI003B51977E
MNAAREGGPVGQPTRRCPVCGRPAAHEVRPFCSKRCADIDLHRWLGGHYRVPVIEEDAGSAERPADED